jgi:CxxC motif-containing protein
MKAENITREMVCIVCPMGCRLTVTVKDGEVAVEGNRCQRGEIYGREEILAPKRIVTATCRLRDPAHPRLPVRTDKALPYEHIQSLLDDIYTLSIETPVKAGDVLIENYKGTGINILAARSVPGY